MIPSIIEVMDDLPLTPGGKIDHKALPAPAREPARFRPPRTAVEASLCRAFASVLGLPQVGIDDGFFALGGDSILSILLVTRAREAGLELSAADVFQYQTVEALATAARPLDDVAPNEELGEPVGDLPATPIIRWLFDRGGPIDRFSQSLMLVTPPELTPADLTRLLQHLLDSHAALRLRVTDSGDGDLHLRVLPAGAVSAETCFTTVGLVGLDDSARTSRMHDEAWAAGGRLSPSAGHLLEAVWFRQPGRDRLLLLIHHVAVDTASWRLLVQDLRDAWTRVAVGQLPAPPPPGTPFRVWAQRLAATAEAHASELPQWEAALQRAGTLLPSVTLDHARDTVATAKHLQITLPAGITRALIADVPNLFHAGTQDALLTALLLAIEAWRRGRGDEAAGTIGIDLESHGRNAVDGVDLGRTVGWFTSVYPVVLDAPEIDLADAFEGGLSFGRALKAVKEQVRSVPGRGHGYGVLRYLHAAAGGRLAAYRSPQIGFNYLGRAESGQSGPWTPAEALEQIGGGFDPRLPLAHLLEVTAITAGDGDNASLTATWVWAGEHLADEEVRLLAEHWQRALAACARHVARPDAGGHTPSDFGRVALEQSHVDLLELRCGAIEEVLPLSPLQEGLLFHALYDEESPDVYTVQLILEIEGGVDASRLRASADTLLERHAILRASLHHDGLPRPVQVIARKARAPWREVDLGADDARTQCASLVEADRLQRFDLARGPLLRFTLIHLAQERHVFVLTHHHVLVDGWSTPLLVAELLQLYQTGGDTTALAPVRPYSEYLDWLSQRDREHGLRAWRTYLAGIEGATRLSAGPDRGENPRLPSRWDGDLSPDATAQVQRLARTHGVTINTVVQAVLACLLSRLTGRDDVVFGMTVAGRPPELTGVDKMIGLFINTVPVRIRVRPGQLFSALLHELHDAQLAVIPHQYLGLADIQREAGTADLFDTLLVFENYPLDRAALAHAIGDLRITAAEGRDAGHYPFTVVISPGTSLHVRIDYDPARFAAPAADVLARRFLRLLEAAACAPEAPVYELDLLDRDERTEILERFNAQTATGGEATLVERFEAQVGKTPDGTAVTFEGAALSYGELNARANRLAHRLIAAGVRPESLVGIALERSLDLVVAVVATLKAGGAYLPLDPDYPPARLEQMLADARPAAIITTAGAGAQLSHDRVTLVIEDDRGSGPASDRNPTDDDRHAPVLPGHPAYVIYTSGSTGVPKGVLVSHYNVTRLFTATDAWFSFGANDVWTLFHSYAFDFSVWELWGALLYGGRLVVVPRLTSRSPAEFLELLADEQVTVLNQTPSAFYQLMQADAERPDLGDRLTLRTIVFGGEALEPARLAPWFARHRDDAPTLINMYGITETTVHVSYQPLDRERAARAGGSVIGGNIPDLRIYVLDAGLEPVPIGVTGELYVAGGRPRPRIPSPPRADR